MLTHADCLDYIVERMPKHHVSISVEQHIYSVGTRGTQHTLYIRHGDGIRGPGTLMLSEPTADPDDFADVRRCFDDWYAENRVVDHDTPLSEVHVVGVDGGKLAGGAA